MIDWENHLPMDQRNADAFNGMIVRNSKVEDPEDYVDENRERLKMVLARRRKSSMVAIRSRLDRSVELHTTAFRYDDVVSWLFNETKVYTPVYTVT